MQGLEQQCTAICITQWVDRGQGYVANDKEEWAGGFPGLSMWITQHEQRCVWAGAATSAESQLANRAARWVFAEGHTFFLSLPPQHLRVIFLICLFLRRDPICQDWPSKQHQCFWLLLEQSHSKYPGAQASSSDRCLECLERKIHYI